MNSFELALDRGYKYRDKYYCERGWQTYLIDNGPTEPDQVYDVDNPIQSIDIDDAVQCEIIGSLIGAQRLSEPSAYDKLLDIYLTVMSSYLTKGGTKKSNLVEIDTMNTLIQINHPVDHERKGDSRAVISNLLVMVKVQLELARIYSNWSSALKAEKPVSFTDFCKYAEVWEDATGDDAVLDSLKNRNRPLNPALLVDFVDYKGRIIRLIDQFNYELECLGENFTPEDVAPGVNDDFDTTDFDAYKTLNETSVDDNNAAWDSFVEKHRATGWLPFHRDLDEEENSQDNAEDNAEEDDEFDSGLTDKDFS